MFKAAASGRKGTPPVCPCAYAFGDAQDTGSASPHGPNMSKAQPNRRRQSWAVASLPAPDRPAFASGGQGLRPLDPEKASGGQGQPWNPEKRRERRREERRREERKEAQVKVGG